MSLPDSGVVVFPSACPGCEDFDPRRHQEVWCMACRPEDGRIRTPTGADDDLVSLEWVGSGIGTEPDPANQRAASELWGANGA